MRYIRDKKYNKEYTENSNDQKPIYVFRLIRDTGEIQRYEVTNYFISHAVVVFCLPDIHNTYRVRISDFNKVKSGKVVSHTDSTEAAVRLFIAYLEEKINKVQSDLNRYKELNAKLHLYKAIGD